MSITEVFYITPPQATATQRCNNTQHRCSHFGHCFITLLGSLGTQSQRAAETMLRAINYVKKNSLRSARFDIIMTSARAHVRKFKYHEHRYVYNCNQPILFKMAAIRLLDTPQILKQSAAIVRMCGTFITACVYPEIDRIYFAHYSIPDKCFQHIYGTSMANQES